MSTSPSTLPVPQAILATLNETTRLSLARLYAHTPELTLTPSALPRTRLAAVLALLFEDADSGQLRVLLTTRAKTLRSHPGQTALPGGKVDEGDGADIVRTALREAFEEVALPVDSPYVHVLCRLRPFFSAARLLVTPVVAFLSDPSVLSTLRASESEVARIFSHPLEAVLDPTLARGEPLAEKGGEDWPYEEELYNVNDMPVDWLGTYRYHRLRSSASPVKGLTAEILISIAEIAYKRETTYERWAPGQPVGVVGIMKGLELGASRTQAGSEIEHAHAASVSAV